jgi:hypothetical protein
MKALNAYEFERHAGAKSKHPNSHIFFENGKSVYAVVQELKNSPQEMLFDAIQTVTGATINQRNFRSWKCKEFSVCMPKHTLASDIKVNIDYLTFSTSNFNVFLLFSIIPSCYS